MDEKELTIDESLAHLDQIIARMQSDELSLEDTFAMYKEGLALVEACGRKIEKIQCDIELIQSAEEQ